MSNHTKFQLDWSKNGCITYAHIWAYARLRGQFWPITWPNIDIFQWNQLYPIDSVNLRILCKFKKFWRQQRQKSWRFLAFWAPKIFGDLNQNSVNKISAKSSYLAILKISCKNIEKWRRSRKKCKVRFCKITNWDIGDFGDFWGLSGTRINILTVIWSKLAHNT